MKRFTTALWGLALVTAIAAPPLNAQQAPVPGTPLQVAEMTAAPGTERMARNVSALTRRDNATETQQDHDKPHPPGAQALMVLGIALIVSPAMFRGAFSN